MQKVLDNAGRDLFQIKIELYGDTNYDEEFDAVKIVLPARTYLYLVYSE